MSDFRDFLAEQMEDPEFREAYERISHEEDEKLAQIRSEKIRKKGKR